MANDLYQDSLKDSDRLLKSNPRIGPNNSSGGLSSNNFQYKNLLHSLKPKENIANSNSKSDGPNKSADENNRVSLKLNDTGKQIVVSSNNSKPPLEKSSSIGSNNNLSLIAESNPEKTEHIVDVGKLRSIFDKSNESNNVQLRTAPIRRNERPYSEILKQKEIKLTRNSSFESIVSDKQPVVRSKLDLDKILISNASTSDNGISVQDNNFDNAEHESGILPIGASKIDVNSILAPVFQDADKKANVYDEINVAKGASIKSYELPIENIIQIDRLKRIEQEHSVNQLITTKRKSLKERLDDMLTEDEKVPDPKVYLTNKLDQHEIIENLPKDNKLSWKSFNSETVQYDQVFKEDDSTSETKQVLSNGYSHTSNSEILNIRKSALERFDEFISHEVPSEDLSSKFDHNKNLINSINDDQGNQTFTDSESSETELTDDPVNYLNLNSFKKKPFSKLRSSLENISNISDKPNLHKSEKTAEVNLHSLEVAEVHHENVDLDMSLNLADSTSDSICSNQTTDTEEEISDNEVEKIILPPPPVKSSLSTHLKSGPKKNVLFREENLIDSILTYGAAEYDRANAEIDPIASSAEWELEKRVDKMDVFSVDLQKDGKGLGLSIIGLGVGTETGVEKLGIFVKTLTENGASQKDGRIQVNDQILEVNGISLVGVTQQFAAQTLKNTSGTVRFLMGRDKSRRTNFAPGSPLADNPEIQHFLQDMNNVIQQMEEVEKRASTAESIVDEIKQELLKAEERAYAAEHALKETKEKLAAASESPFISGGRKLKNEIKLKKGTKNDKVEELQRNLKEANERLSASEESLLQLSSINRDKEIVELHLKIDENVAQLKSSAEVIASLQNEINKKQMELDQFANEKQNLTELVEKLKTELESERALFLEKESYYNEQSEKFEKFYNAKYEELLDKHQTLEKSVAIYENNHQKAKEKVINLKQQLQDYEATVALVDTLKNELDDLKFKNTKQTTEISELKLRIRELEGLSAIQNNKIEVLEEEVLESRNIREITKFFDVNEIPSDMVVKKHEDDQLVITEKKEDAGVDDFVLIEKEINSDEINSTLGSRVSQHNINKIDNLDKHQVSMKVVENEDGSRNIKNDDMGTASLSVLCHKSYETVTNGSTQLIVLPENFDSLPEDNVDVGCNDEGQFLIIAEDVEDEMSFLSATNNHMINTSGSEWKQINTDEKADEIAAMVIDRSPKKKSRILSENSSSEDEEDSATNASNKIHLLDSLNNRRPSVKMDTSYLRKSMVVEGIDFEESVLDSENISLESAAKNTQDNLLRSYSFSAIPKTSLLGNQYLHDKRTASNTRRKPSRGTQGLLASKVDDPQDTEIINKVPAVSKIQNGSKPSHLVAISMPNLSLAAEKPEKIKSNKFGFHIPKVFKKGKKLQSQSSLNLSPQSSNKLSPHSDVLIESKESITDAHNDANEPERANDSATDEEVVPFADKELSMSVELIEKSKAGSSLSKEALNLTSSPMINERAIDVDVGLDFKNEDELLPLGSRKDPSEWDVRQVGLFLVEMNLSQYVNSFQQHNVDGQAFLALKGSLLKDLGVLNSEHRNEIKKKLKELRSTRGSFNKGKVRTSKGKVSFWKGRYKVTN